MLVTTEARSDVAVLTLNRDEKRNAISVDLAQALIDALRAAQETSRCVLLTGAGSCFSAGADLGEDKLAGGFFEVFDELVGAVRGCPVPVVAYVNGPAIGAGMMVSMACDIRVAHPSARFRIPLGDMAIGVNEWTVRALSELVGGSRARAMLLGGLEMDAGEAVSAGYAVRGSSFSDALEVAELLSSKAPLTLRDIKMEFAPDLFGLQERQAAQDAAFASEDVRESARARAEKRAPRFTGR